MALTSKSLLVISALVLAACNNPDKYGDGANGAGGPLGNGFDQSSLGGAMIRVRRPISARPLAIRFCSRSTNRPDARSSHDPFGSGAMADGKLRL